MVIVLGSAILLAEIFTPLFTRIYFDPTSPEGILCTRITRILLPAQLFFFAGGVLASVLLVRKQFSFQALAPLIYNSASSLAESSRQLIGISSSASAHSSEPCSALLNAYGAHRAGLRYHRILDFKHPGLREWVRLSLPLMLGVTIITLDNQILGYFAKHGAGDISRLNYAKRLFTAPMAIIGQAAGAASLPFFASLFGRSQFASFASAVNRSVSRLVAFSLLGSAAMIALAQPAVDLIFRRGSFNAADATATATYFAIFAISLALWTAQAIYARAFYAPAKPAPCSPEPSCHIASPSAKPQHSASSATSTSTSPSRQTGTLAVMAHRRHLVPSSAHPAPTPTIARKSPAAIATSSASRHLTLHLILNPNLPWRPIALTIEA
jgi:putative peptidoglycan lipid II flippase